MQSAALPVSPTYALFLPPPLLHPAWYLVGGCCFTVSDAVVKLASWCLVHWFCYWTKGVWLPESSVRQEQQFTAKKVRVYFCEEAHPGDTDELLLKSLGAQWLLVGGLYRGKSLITVTRELGSQSVLIGQH